MMPIVDAQYGAPAGNATQELFEECTRLGIEPDRCSQNAILAKQRIGPNPLSPTFDGVVFATMIGSGVALVIGVLAVTKIRKVKKHI
jgi:hypothetical protein